MKLVARLLPTLDSWYQDKPGTIANQDGSARRDGPKARGRRRQGPRANATRQMKEFAASVAVSLASPVLVIVLIVKEAYLAAKHSLTPARVAPL